MEAATCGLTWTPNLTGTHCPAGKQSPARKRSQGHFVRIRTWVCLSKSGILSPVLRTTPHSAVLTQKQLRPPSFTGQRPEMLLGVTGGYGSAEAAAHDSPHCKGRPAQNGHRALPVFACWSPGMKNPTGRWPQPQWHSHSACSPVAPQPDADPPGVDANQSCWGHGDTAPTAVARSAPACSLGDAALYSLPHVTPPESGTCFLLGP